jgi:hypothetical protein
VTLLGDTHPPRSASIRAAASDLLETPYPLATARPFAWEARELVMRIEELFTWTRSCDSSLSGTTSSCWPTPQRGSWRHREV